MNLVILVGRLGRDVEARTSKSGMKIAAWTMATGRKYTSKDGKDADTTQWHNCVAFGKNAETAERFLSKGSEVAVWGHSSTSSWEKDGEKRHKTEVIVDSLKLIGGKREPGSKGNDRRGLPDSDPENGFMSDVDDNSDLPF